MLSARADVAEGVVAEDQVVRAERLGGQEVRTLWPAGSRCHRSSGRQTPQKVGLCQRALVGTSTNSVPRIRSVKRDRSDEGELALRVLRLDEEVLGDDAVVVDGAQLLRSPFVQLRRSRTLVMKRLPASVSSISR